MPNQQGIEALCCGCRNKQKAPKNEPLVDFATANIVLFFQLSANIQHFL